MYTLGSRKPTFNAPIYSKKFKLFDLLQISLSLSFCCLVFVAHTFPFLHFNSVITRASSFKNPFFFFLSHVDAKRLTLLFFPFLVNHWQSNGFLRFQINPAISNHLSVSNHQPPLLSGILTTSTMIMNNFNHPSLPLTLWAHHLERYRKPDCPTFFRVITKGSSLPLLQATKIEDMTQQCGCDSPLIISQLLQFAAPTDSHRHDSCLHHNEENLFVVGLQGDLWVEVCNWDLPVKIFLLNCWRDLKNLKMNCWIFWNLFKSDWITMMRWRRKMERTKMNCGRPKTDKEQTCWRTKITEEWSETRDAIC